MNEYSCSSAISNGDYNRKPPSPSPRRRTPVMSNPAPPARRTSPSPAPPARRGSSPPHKPRSPSPKIDSYSPSGQGYYTKYSTATSNSSNYSSAQGPPASFPTCPSPSPAGRPTLQTPPKRVDDLMTELSEFDPSIQHTSFNEQAIHSSNTRHQHQTRSVEREEENRIISSRREPSPVKPAVKQPSTPGPAVYYPPGELFSSSRTDGGNGNNCPPAAAASEISASGPADPNVTLANTTLETSASSRGRSKARAEYGYKEKGRYQDAESKQGAAVIPICLPLCCAAPCVILWI